MFSSSQFLQFIRSQRRFIAFGFVLAFVSSPGQTYFIGIFGPSIQSAFELSHTDWGAIYLIGTLMSAMLLSWSGQFIDRIDLRWFSVIVVFGLCIACASISFSVGTITLIFSIFLLRHFGQGLTSHAAITSMARYIDKDRGKAIALASMGYSLGEATLPVAAVIAISIVGWRSTFQVTALAVFVFIPISIWLLKGHSRRHKNYLAELEHEQSDSSISKSSTRRQMLKERRFYLILPAVLSPPYVVTALFFHHLTLASSKDWSEVWVTGSYWIYSVAAVLTSLLAGPLIDRFSAKQVVRYYLVPMILGLLILVPAINSIWVVPYMIFIGINTGLYFTAVSALWAELYGTKYLGSIKSFAGAIMVFASALGPFTIGALLDIGYTFEHVCLLFAAICLVSNLILFKGLKLFKTPV